jgi:hypothetical protein
MRVSGDNKHTGVGIPNLLVAENIDIAVVAEFEVK